MNIKKDKQKMENHYVYENNSSAVHSSAEKNLPVLHTFHHSQRFHSVTFPAETVPAILEALFDSSGKADNFCARLLTQ